MIRHDDHVVDYVDDYLHDVLTPEDAQYVESHCQSCEICRLALEEARQRKSVLQSVPANEPSQTLIDSTLSNIGRYSRGRERVYRIFWRAAGVAIAAAVLIVASLHLYFYRLAPSPYDIRVLGQDRLLADSDGSLLIRVLRLNGQKPVAAAPVKIDLYDKQTGKTVSLAQFTTDETGNGEPRFHLPDWKDGDYELRITARPEGDKESYIQPIKLHRSWKVMLSTDKPIYQPGQTIHMRTLSLRRPNLKPLAGQEAVFTLTDPSGNILFKERSVTSAYGISSADCALASELPEGQYAVECRIGDTESKSTVEVQRYVLPKFKVDVTLDAPYYAPGQIVHGTVAAGYFFGKPVANAQVEISLTNADTWRSTLRKIDLRTDGSGQAKFDLRLPTSLIGRQQDAGDARVSIVANVRDSAAQEQQRVVTRTVTNRPLRLEVIPEGGQLIRGVPNTIYVIASYADGRPARARLTIGGEHQQIQTSNLGIASFEITPELIQTRLALRAVDAKGIVATRIVSLDTAAPGEDFLVRTHKAVYNAGDTMRLIALSSRPEPIFVDLVKDDQTLLTHRLPVSDGKGSYALDLPPDIFGTIQLCAYRFGSDGLPVRKSRILYVRPPQALKVQATLDKSEYRPGQRARISFALTDKSGQPTPGAISLAAVDEAVFSVLNQAPGMERTFFNLEQDLLKPLYTIYDWSPDFTAGPDDPQRDALEQALFARTWRQERNPIGSPGSDSGATRHMLLASSHEINRTSIAARRESALNSIHTAWIVLAGTLTLGGLLLLGLRFKVIGSLLVAVLVITLAASVMMPSLSRHPPSAQMATREAADANERPAPTMEPDLAVPRVAIGMADPAAVMEAMPSVAGPTSEPEAAPPRLRQSFPETLLWRPELITDDSGRATLDVELADSITTWRMTASAVAADGRLGATQSGIRVFQPFFVDLNLPVALTRNDEVSIPVTVYNYLDRSQSVELTLDTGAAWFESLDAPDRRIDLRPGDVRSISFRIRASRVGPQQLRITARGSGVADAIERQIEVIADGHRTERVVSGVLAQPAQLDIELPTDAIEGSARLFLKLHPCAFSQLVEGLDAIFQMPYGCFEQTSSTTYPNVLALDYLRRTGKTVPAVEAKAKQYIHLGYQRLIGFEVSGGGFDWFGRPPANTVLTAYGLMEFEDMVKVHHVDSALIDRTRKWLLGKRNPDGSWPANQGALHENPTGSSDLGTTAYIAWAVFSNGAAADKAPATRDRIKANTPQSIADPYTLALVANALLGIDPSGSDARLYLDRLVEMKQASADGKLVWWTQAAQSRTAFYGSGRSGAVETTSLAALALIRANRNADLVRGALAWIIQQKDPSGTWYSTQATVLALKALIAGTGRTMNATDARGFQLAFDAAGARDISISADQADVMKQLDLTDYLKAGKTHVALSQLAGGESFYQFIFRYNTPGPVQPKGEEPLSITVDYDRSTLSVGQTLAATARVVNQMAQTAPMVIVDLPIPAGFAPITADLDKLRDSGAIARYQLTSRTIIVYLRSLAPAKSLQLRYRLKATMPVRITVPAAKAYEYYDPSRKGSSRTTRLTVTPAV